MKITWINFIVPFKLCGPEALIINATLTAYLYGETEQHSYSKISSSRITPHMDSLSQSNYSSKVVPLLRKECKRDFSFQNLELEDQVHFLTLPWLLLWTITSQ